MSGRTQLVSDRQDGAALLARRPGEALDRTGDAHRSDDTAVGIEDRGGEGGDAGLSLSERMRPAAASDGGQCVGIECRAAQEALPVFT